MRKKEAKQLKEDSEAGIANAKKILAEEAATIAKYKAIEEGYKKKQDTKINKNLDNKTQK